MKKFKIGLLAAAVLACPDLALAQVQPQYTVPDILGFTAAAQTAVPTTDLQRVLASKRSANMAVTTDQSMTIVSGVTKYTVDRVIATNCSATPVLAAGGLYTAASKGGSAIVAAGQAYTALTSPGAFLPMTLAITTSTFTAGTLFFSLTVANGTALTCDIYVIGTDLT